MSPSLRPATSADVPAVTALEAAVFGIEAWSAASVSDELTGPRRHPVVAVDGDALVGYAVGLLAGDVVDLQRIVVAPAARRAGLAGRLLTEVRAGAVEVGAERLMLEVAASNGAALAFYAGQGLVEIHRRPRYYRDGSDAVVMSGPVEVPADAR